MSRWKLTPNVRVLALISQIYLSIAREEEFFLLYPKKRATETGEADESSLRIGAGSAKPICPLRGKDPSANAVMVEKRRRPKKNVRVFFIMSLIEDGVLAWAAFLSSSPISMR